MVRYSTPTLWTTVGSVLNLYQAVMNDNAATVGNFSIQAVFCDHDIMFISIVDPLKTGSYLPSVPPVAMARDI